MTKQNFKISVFYDGFQLELTSCFKLNAVTEHWMK